MFNKLRYLLIRLLKAVPKEQLPLQEVKLVKTSVPLEEFKFKRIMENTTFWKKDTEIIEKRIKEAFCYDLLNSQNIQLKSIYDPTNDATTYYVNIMFAQK